MASASETSTTGLPLRVAAPLAYAGWWLTGLILWFAERRDHAIRFHAAQSMAAFGLIATVIAGCGLLALSALSFLPVAFVPLLWLGGAAWAGGVLLWIVVMWKAATRRRAWRIPIAAELADRLLLRS